jgi:hypothetical protein
MKLIIAYALIIIGVPIFVGHIFGLICSMPISIIVGLSRRGTETPEQAAESAAKETTEWISSGTSKMAIRDRIAHGSLDVFSGFGTIVAAGLLFHLMGLTPSVLILLIIGGWEYLLTKQYSQSGRTFYCTVAGMLIGWVVVLRLFSVANATVS